MRHGLTTLAGLYVAFYLFSYPLFDIYKLAMPKSVINKYRVEHNILGWNPDYVADFSYQGTPATVRLSFVNKHTAKLRVKVGDESYRGIAMLHMQNQQIERYTAARNKFLSAHISSVVFTRLGANTSATDRDESGLEKTLTAVLNHKLKGQMIPLSMREGVRVRVNYRPLFDFVPHHPSDWLIKVNNQLSAPVQL